MKTEHRGRVISKRIVKMLNDGLTNPVMPFKARFARLPRVEKKGLKLGVADVTVSPMSKVGDDQDQGNERLNYGITIGVTGTLESEADSEGRTIQPAESKWADMLEDLVEQIQDHLSHDENLFLEIETEAENYEAELELPFVNDPVYNLELIREAAIYQSITIFNYLSEINRHG